MYENHSSVNEGFQITGDLLAAAGVGVWVYNPATKKTRFSEELERIAGYAAGGLGSDMDSWRGIIEPAYLEGYNRSLYSVLDNQSRSSCYEYEIRRPDGQKRWVQDKITVSARAADGSPTELTGILQDVSGLKLTNSELEAAFRHNEHVAQLIGLGAVTWDVKNGQLSYNDGYQHMLGHGILEQSGPLTTLEGLVHPEDLPRLMRSIDKFIKSGERVFIIEIRIKRRDGRYIWVNSVCSVTKWDEEGRPWIISGGVLDIDERVRFSNRLEETLAELEEVLAEKEELNAQIRSEAKRTSDSLVRQRQLNQVMFNANPQINILFDDKYEVINCNTVALDFFGGESMDSLMDGLYGKLDSYLPAVASDGNRQIPLKERLDLTVRDGFSEGEEELNINGRVVRISTQYKKIPYEDSFAIAMYIKEQSELQERTQIMVNAAPVAWAFVGESGRVIGCNQAALNLFGYSSMEEYSRHLGEIVRAEQAGGSKGGELMSARIREAFATGSARFDFTMTATDGTQIPVDIKMMRVGWKKGYALSCYAQDMREIVKAGEEVLHRTRLLEAVNEIAGRLMTAGFDDFNATVTDSLRLIAESTEIERVCVWRDSETEDGHFSDMIYEYAVEGMERKLSYTRLNYAEIPYWRQCMQQDRVLNGPVSSLPGEERTILEREGVRSMLAVPIYSDGRPWGYMRFIDSDRDRCFLPVEEQMLESCGIILVAAILRNETTRQLVEAGVELQNRDRLLTAVNEVARLLLQVDNFNFQRRVWISLKTLGESVDACRVSFWRNNAADGGVTTELLSGWQPSDGSGQNMQELDGGLLRIADYLPEWDVGVRLRHDITIKREDMTEQLLGLAEKLDIPAATLIPIYNRGSFWGFMNFSAADPDRVFSEKERNLLRSGGMLIASAYIRNEVNESMERAKDAALAGTRAKSEFLSRMSHEMRTPLNAVIGMATIASQSDSPHKISECLGKINNSSRQLLSIINDVLDMSKIEEGKFEIDSRPFNFDKMLQNALNVVSVRISDKRQDLKLSTGDMRRYFMIGDELRMSQIFINLLGNATKFTPDGGSIGLEITEREAGNGDRIMRVVVSDTGIGISEEQQKSLFRPFEQADGGRSRRHEGTGLGLAITKTIVEMMGGEITLESELGSGSRFIFELPVSYGEEIPAPRVGVKLTDQRVLVVDDDPDILSYFRSVISGFSMDCDIAPTGEAAVELVARAAGEERPYRLIFLDCRLPGINGGETARQIRDIMGDEVSIIMISGLERAEAEREAENSGIVDFLPKPVMPSMLYDTIVSKCASELPAQLAADDSPDWRGKAILMAEDIEINREIAIALLEDTGVTIECAEDGQHAVSMFKQGAGKYDLVLMDIQMPIMDGLEASRQIRAIDRHVPIVAMTANAFKEDIQDCLDAGMNGHVAKPIDREPFIAAITAALG